MTSWLSNLIGKGERFVASVGAQVVKQSAGPDTLSADAECMVDQWQLIADVMEGNDAIKAGGERYLPRFARESEQKYQRRLADAPWRPIFPSAIESLTSRPFAKPVTVEGNVSPEMKAFVADVDMLGNNINVFSRGIFNDGVTFGVVGIFVDFNRIVRGPDARPLSIAEEREQNVRPFWVKIRPQDFIDVRTDVRNGKQVVTHARWHEWAAVHDGFAESFVERVRHFELDDAGKPHWKLWEKPTNGSDFVIVAEGDLTISEIPLVLFFTGRRKGTFAVKPPLYDLAIVALEHYRAMARSTEIESFAGWPTLVGVGMAAPEPKTTTDASTGERETASQIELGPGITLFAPPSGIDGKTDWKIIGPDAALVAEVAKSPERVMDEFRRLAMEPVIRKSGNVTATEASIDNSRAHSAIEAWAGTLKDALDQALKFASEWLGQSDQATANVSTDFVGMVGSTEEAKVIADAQKRSVLSAKTERAELKRRSILAPDWDEEQEELQIAIEREGLEPEEPINPVNGDVLPFDRAVAS